MQNVCMSPQDSSKPIEDIRIVDSGAESVQPYAETEAPVPMTSTCPYVQPC